MPKISAKDLRQKYFDFFVSKQHKLISSASLIPENDPTVLFTTAGMHPLVPYLMGEKHPAGKRLVNAQKCIRTSDIDEVGDSTHHTFFEMLGNWSLGDYFKREAIEWSWEFLTSPEWLGLDKKLLAVSVFAGDENTPFDKESFEIWKSLGMPEKRIAKLGKKENWWGPAGETGPCGADTEMFYWVGDPEKVPESFNDDNDNWVEIWNNVFMEFNKNKKGELELLKQKNVDTGMGLERILAIMNSYDDNYKTELFSNLIKKIETFSNKKYNDSEEVKEMMRIIADHIKASVFIMGDERGIAPSNTDQGYIVRRLIRRAIRYAKQLGFSDQKLWTKELAQVVIDDYSEVYNELEKNKNFVLSEIEKEEKKFLKTVNKGLKKFQKIKGKFKSSGKVSAEDIFNLYQTYGFPLEMSMEELLKMEIEFDALLLKKEFELEQKKHQELSRTASAGKFKGGLADATEDTIKLHTTAHLLLASLRKVLGEHVQQKGSNITSERLRFDFSHHTKMTDEEKKQVEDLVNKAIEKKLDVDMEEMSLEEAKKAGAVGVFDSKYGENVKVYTIGKGNDMVSKEICGGPHIKNTKELGHFKIKKEKSSGSGVRRIKAVLE